jgi:hypothetical protein
MKQNKEYTTYSENSSQIWKRDVGAKRRLEEAQMRFRGQN